MILITIAVLLSVTAATAQSSFYAEWYRKGSGELHSKNWVTPKYVRSESYNNGEKTIMIFNLETKKAYVIFESKKTCMVMEDIDKFSLNKVLGYDLEVGRSTKREFKGIDEIEGVELEHYYVTSESTLKTGNTSGGSYDEWIYPPLKSANYNGSYAHNNTHYSMDRTVIIRKLQMGPQPEHLFQVPEGYKTTVMPVGGLLEMITGKPREENVKNVDATAKEAGDAMKSVSDKMKDLNDPNKSQEEKMKSVMELFNQIGNTKKK